MSRFEQDVEVGLRQIADRATPSPDAWASILERIDSQEPITETEIIMLTDNTLPTRRWPLYAAAAAVVALLVGGIALVNRDDGGTVPAEEPEPVPEPAPAIEPSLIGSTTGASPFFPDSGNGGYEVSVYDWDLTLSDDLTSLSGMATITATATQDLQRFSLDARELQIESVAVDGTTAEFSVIEPEVVITMPEPLAAGSEFVVEVVYAADEPAAYQPSGTNWRGWWAIPGEQVFVDGYGPLGPTWTPVDHDVDAPPARYIMRLDVPEGFTATASGIPTVDEETGETVWDTGIGVFGATFAVADFETNVVEGAIPVEVSVKQGSQTDRIETQVLEHLPFLESLFGPFPYERLGISVLPGRLDGAIQYSAPMRIVMADTASDLLMINLLATQWVGNAVTTTAEDSWLYRGLTEYSELLWIESASDDIDATTSRLTTRMPPTTRALDEVDSVEELYDDDANQRAVLVYHALRLEIGDDAFFTTIREFVRRNLNTTVGVEDLQAVAEEISEQDLDRFFTAWVSEAEVPQLPDAAQQ